MDLNLSRAKLAQDFVPYWLGPVAPGWVIPSHLMYAFKDRFGISYYDCGRFFRRLCGPMLGVGSQSLCPSGRFSPAGYLLDHAVPENLSIRGGVLVDQPKSDTGPTAYAGRTEIQLDRVVGASLEETLAALRRAGRREPAPLPPTGFPDWFWSALREVEESFARTHDERATAEELGLQRWQVSSRRGLAKRLRELGVDRHLDCPAG
jgi:hypothetical protein